MTKKMDLEYYSLLMEANFKGNFTIANVMEQEHLLKQMEIVLMDYGKIIS